jgi:putative transposase
MIDPEHALPISKQAEELQMARSTIYYTPRPVSEADLFLMRRIDELHMSYPFAGSRMLRDMLNQQGLEVGRGRWAANVFVERLWRSLKYEHVYLHAYTSVAEARVKIGGYFEFYNSRRPHSSLGAQTPDQVYFHRPPEALAA